jgi:hypothetical protein
VTFNPPADLSNYRGIELQSYVPEGQSACGAQLSVILREEGGATYIANTGRSLAKPGWRRSVVWFDAFSPLGQKRTPTGQLDLTKVASLSIGWGGYFGKTGERISLKISDVRLLTVKK